MGRMIDVEVNEERIKINFPYERELVDVVRALPDRWYDNRTRTWFVPLQHLNYVIRRLDGYHFKFSERLRTLRAAKEESLDAAEVPALAEIPEGTWTISGLNQAAQRALKERFDDSVWVVGELQDFDKNRAAKYRTFFFDLVERPFAGANEIARLKAVLFEQDRRAIEKQLRESDIELRDGVAVRICGKIDLYPKNGRYQIVVKDIDPAYTAGEIELNRERVFQALKRKGIEENNLSISLPVCPLRVGLITSFESDAYNDFIHQLKQSGKGFDVVVHHANVQGVHTESSVLRALKYFEERAQDFDVVAIVRGGGSRSDLAYFDTEEIGEMVCRYPLKVICGVGHQRDTCLLDLIAKSTKTPTAAAEMLVRQVDAFTTSLQDTYRSIATISQTRLARAGQRLLRNGARLEREVTRRLNQARRQQDQLESSIGESARAKMIDARRVVDVQKVRLQTASSQLTGRKNHEIRRMRHDLSMRRLSRELERRRNHLVRETERLTKGAKRSTETEKKKIDNLSEHLGLLDPRRILDRGFAMLRGESGVIASIADLRVGEGFDVIVSDGEIRAQRLEDEDNQ